MFTERIVSGRGWMAVALVIFGVWKPYSILVGAILFGAVNALQMSLPAVGVNFPPRLLEMMPYVFVIVVLIAIYKKAAAKPAALAIPFRRSK